MSRLFNVLPGFTPAPPGMERVVLRVLPRSLLWGSLAVAVPAILLRCGLLVASAQLTTAVETFVLGALLLHWSAVLGIGIAAFIVMVMKGPAYVADAYPLNDAADP